MKSKSLRSQEYFLFVVLSSLFIAFLITSNLIANKFVELDLFFRDESFVVSCGILSYPLTFLITDLLSEFYGRKNTNYVVFGGLIASIFIVVLLHFSSLIPAWEHSNVKDSSYNAVFGNTWRVVGASMLAYLIAQSVDVRLYHFWKKVTRGKKLWLRNNASTVFSQLFDTVLVILVLFIGTEKSDDIPKMIFDGWLFKVLFALFDTPIIYLAVFFIRKHFKLQVGEEFDFNKI